MKVKAVFLEHGLTQDLVDYLEKIPTTSNKELCGRYIVLEGIDMLDLDTDIKKLAAEVERIKRVTEKVDNPWIARDLLDKKAMYVGDLLVYVDKPHGSIKEKLERHTGPLTDQQFKDLMYITTLDIKGCNMHDGKKTTLGDVIKIAVQCMKI